MSAIAKYDIEIIVLKTIPTTFLSWSKVVKALKQLILPKCQDSISVLHNLSALPTFPTKVFLFKEQEILFNIYINFF